MKSRSGGFAQDQSDAMTFGLNFELICNVGGQNISSHGTLVK